MRISAAARLGATRPARAALPPQQQQDPATCSPANAPLTVASVQRLQQTAGNRATSGILAVQRKANEWNFPPQGRVDEPRTGETLFWNIGIGQHRPKKEHEAKIEELAARIKTVLAGDPNATVDVEGLASASGADKSNEPLARRRAQAMLDKLVSHGVPKDRVVVSATGSIKQSASATSEDMARDRAIRVVFAPRTGGKPAAGTSPVTNMNVTDELTAKTAGVSFQNGHLMAGTPTTPGITFHIRAEQTDAMPKPGRRPPRPSKLEYVQNVIPWREVTFKDGSRARMETSGFVLDSSDPYDSITDSSFGPFLEVDAHDGPGQSTGARNQKAEGIIASLEIRDEFRIWVLVRRPDGTRLPLRLAHWSWVGRVRNTTSTFGDGHLVKDDDVSRVNTPSPGVPTSTMPATSPNVTSVGFVADNRGVPPGLSLAELSISKGVLRPPSRKA